MFTQIACGVYEKAIEQQHTSTGLAVGISAQRLGTPHLSIPWLRCRRLTVRLVVVVAVLVRHVHLRLRQISLAGAAQATGQSERVEHGDYPL